MKIYLLPAAPNPTKVALNIAEKAVLGVQMELESIVLNPFKGEQNTPEHLARNPFGSLPVLEAADGTFIFESLPIVEYLEDIFPDQSMWGADPLERGHARNLERIADVRVLNPGAGYVHAVNSPLGLPVNEAVAEYLEPRFKRGFEYFDGLLSDGRDWIAGERVTVADCTLQACLQFLRFRELENLQDYPAVAQWSERYRARPAAQSVLIC